MLKVLNLYSGIGGNRKLWKNCNVTSVEINEEIALVYSKLYPIDSLHICDAKDYFLANYMDYDFIWVSPPCQKNSRLNKYGSREVLPDLSVYEFVIFLNSNFKGCWVVENVVPYYKPLIKAKKIGRHLFWSNFFISDFNISGVENFRNANKYEMMSYLGIFFEENIYYNGNHCPAQILRNAVHPNLGLHVYECFLNSKSLLLFND